jgi:ribosomal protein L11 methyltransferase
VAYLRRFYRLPPDLEDLAVAELWVAGTLGVQALPAPDGRLLLEAWFEAGPHADRPAPELDLAGVEPAGEELVTETDWLARYRAQARPFAVARTFWVDPREPADGAHGPDHPPDSLNVPAGRRLLRLPARAAFGIGSHESTALALELLEDADLRGLSVLDVGTGTGVLAFAALLGGAALAVGYDDDPAAPFHARDNSGLNGLAPRLFAGRAAALRPGPVFDLALVNVVPEQILPEMPEVAARLRPGGGVIFSGILAERGPQVLQRMRALGFAEHARAEAGDWIAFHLVHQ